MKIVAKINGMMYNPTDRSYFVLLKTNEADTKQIQIIQKKTKKNVIELHI